VPIFPLAKTEPASRLGTNFSHRRKNPFKKVLSGTTVTTRPSFFLYVVEVIFNSGFGPLARAVQIKNIILGLPSLFLGPSGFAELLG
jgi:hypothetical protein